MICVADQLSALDVRWTSSWGPGVISRRAASILAGAVVGAGAFFMWAWQVHERYCQRWAVMRPSEPCVDPGDGLVLMPLFAAVGALTAWILYDWLRDRRRSRAAT